MPLIGSLISIVKQCFAFEPAYVLFALAQGISELADTNLYLQKSCRYNNITTEPDIKTPCDNERAGIDYVTYVNSKYITPGAIICISIITLMSSWIDRGAGRMKFSLLLLMTVKFLQLIGMCLHSYFWSWPVLIAFFTDSFFAFGVCMRIISIVYVCSVSSVENRTLRLTVLSVLHIFTDIISSGSSGFLLRNFGFLNTYILCSVLSLISIVHMKLFLQYNTEVAKNTGYLKGLRDFFDVTSIMQALKLVFKKRDAHGRIIISLLFVVNNLSAFSFFGERSVLYLYLRYKFGWNEQDYGIYALYKMLGTSIGSVICVVLNKCFKISDSAIGTFAAFWDIIASLGLFFASENWQLYLVPLLDIFHGFTLTVANSILSQFFQSCECGQLFSVNFVLTALSPFTFPAYNLLFSKTMNSVPGAIFLLSSVVEIFIFILLWICYKLMKTLPKKTVSEGHQL